MSVSFIDEKPEEISVQESEIESQCESHFGFEVGKVTGRIFQFGKKCDEMDKQRFLLAKLLLSGVEVDIVIYLITVFTISIVLIYLRMTI